MSALTGVCPEIVWDHGPSSLRRLGGLHINPIGWDARLELDSILMESVSAVAPERSTEPDHGAAVRLFRNLGVLSGSQVITWSVALVWTLFVPRAVGPRGMGLLVLYWSVGAVLTTAAGMGTKTLLVREVAARPDRTPRLIGAALYLRSFTVAPALVATLIYMRLGSFSGEQSGVIVLAFVATVVNLLTDPLQAAVQGLERMEFIAIGDVFVKVSGAAGAIALILTGHGAMAIVILTLVIGWMLLVMYVRVVHRLVAIDLTWDWAAVRQLFKDSLMFWAFTISVTVYMWIDSIMLAVLAPVEQLGWYGVPTKLMFTLMFVPTIIWAVWLPRVSMTYSRNPADLARASRPPLELTLALALPIAVGAALTAAPLISLLYGPGFGRSIPVFVVLALAMVPVALDTGIGYVLIASQRQGQWTLVMAAAAVVNPLLNLVLIPYFQRHAGSGALGAAYAVVITETLILCAGAVLIHRMADRGMLNRFIKTALATIVMALLVAAAAPLGPFAQVPIGLAAFAVTALLLQLLSREELAYFWRLAAGSLRRRAPA
jgi:O-antigen/teichoic acid export membrane protein